MATTILSTALKRSFRPCILNHTKASQVLLHTTSPDFSDSERKTSKQFALTFDEYQTLKRSLRTKQRVAGIPFGFAGITCCSMTMAYINPDMFDATPENVQLILGLDPLVFCGIAGCVSGALGYVVGINVFKLFWAKLNQEKATNLQERDTDFLNRLEKHRFQEDSKFEDDYYGESIKTLSDYRQWVRTHQKKRETSEKFKVSSKTPEAEGLPS